MTDRGPVDGSEALDELYWRDEILQAMYWMRGEGLAAVVEPAALAELLAADVDEVARQLARLAGDGHVAASAERPVRYRLTPLGVAEGGRSFQDEFADYLRLPHGECGPKCWCRDPDRAGEPCPSELEREREPSRGR